MNSKPENSEQIHIYAFDCIDVIALIARFILRNKRDVVIQADFSLNLGLSRHVQKNKTTFYFLQSFHKCFIGFECKCLPAKSLAVNSQYFLFGICPDFACR